jgi:methyl-accepting chemotaxis protein
METPFAMYDALSAIDVPPEKVRSVVQSMERDMALFATRTQFSALDEHSAARYEMLRAELAASRERMDQFAASFEQINKRFEQVDKHFDQVDKHFEQVDKHFDLMRTEMLSMEQRLENRLTIKLGTFMVIAIGATATIVDLLNR